MPEAAGGYLLLDLNPSIIEGINADDSLQFRRAALPVEQPLREGLALLLVAGWRSPCDRARQPRRSDARGRGDEAPGAIGPSAVGHVAGWAAPVAGSTSAWPRS
jgi:hypothetical protein